MKSILARVYGTSGTREVGARNNDDAISHPMLIVFPIGLWIFSLVCDLIRLAGASGDAWSTVAFFSMVGGLIGALCAAVPGLIDLLFYKRALRR